MRKINHKGTTIIIQVNDPSWTDFANAIVELSADKEKSAAMAKAGRELITESYDNEKLAATLYQFLSKVSV